MDYLFQDETYKIRGAAFEVYKNLGCGYLESVYQEALEIEFNNVGVEFKAQEPVKIHYKKIILKHQYIPDFICFGKIIIELKAVNDIAAEHKAQLMNYLKGADMKLGLLINFGHHPKVQIERIIL